MLARCSCWGYGDIAGSGSVFALRYRSEWLFDRYPHPSVVLYIAATSKTAPHSFAKHFQLFTARLAFGAVTRHAFILSIFPSDEIPLTTPSARNFQWGVLLL